jgi:hypothetical protein
MANKLDQSIKGNDNVQIVVQGNYIAGIDKEEVIALIRSYGYVNREDIIDIVKETIDNIPQEKRIQPNKRLFVPLIQQLSYSTDDDCLKDSYKKLLESSMNIDRISNVHPAFLNILSQLCADEIKILNSLPATLVHLEPVINMRMKIGNKKGLGITQVKYFSDIGYGKCTLPGNICQYLENLERLKLIEIPSGRYLTDQSLYDRLINHFALEEIRNRNTATDSINIYYEYDKMYFQLTSFGINFISCCKSK